MKKILSVLLICVMVFSLCLGGTNAFAEEAELSSTPLKDESTRLEQLLTGFAENLQPGTAGASLKAVKEAVRLMDWGTETKMTEDEIYETLSAFFEDKDDEFYETYMEQLEQLDETYQQLLTEGQEELLESAGCTDTAYPWGGEPIEAVESFFEIMGLRIYTGEYTEFLETYCQAIEEEWPIEELAMAGINMNDAELFGMPDALDFFGFTVRDINNDGVEELLIGFMNDTTEVFDIYTIHDGYLELVLQGGGYNEECHICTDGTVCKYNYFNDTHKGYHFYRLQNGWLNCFGSIICDDSYSPDNIWYIGMEDNWDVTRCSYYPPDMSIQMVQSYEAKYVDNDYIPFSALQE